MKSMKVNSFIIPIALMALMTGCSKGDDKAASSGSTAGTNQPAVPALKELKKEVIKPGTGEGAKNGDMLTMLYRGKLTNGAVFDGNMDDEFKPTPDKDPFALNLGMGMVIKGWDQGLVGVKVGEVCKLSIPPDLGYGDKGSGQIPPNSDLYFTVKCLDIIRQGEENVIDITDVKVGTGPEVKKGDKITVHYVGTLLNGKQFDSSRDKNTPFSFTVGAGEVVPGFDKGVIGMKKDGKRNVRIPPAAAYGANPSNGLPANSVLKFELEVLTVNGK